MKVEPGLVSIRDLLLKAHSGDWSLWLPSFQRRFVWDPVDIKTFLDSFLKGNPSGYSCYGGRRILRTRILSPSRSSLERVRPPRAT
jgi:hypothetical protein